MKFLPIFLFLSLDLEAAVNFSVERSDSMASHKLEFLEGKDEVTVNKTSNWFDEKSDPRLGKLQAPTSRVRGQLKELEKISAQLRETDRRLKGLGSSLQEVAKTDNLHSTYFVLNGYKIQPGSVHFERTKAVALKLDTRAFKLVDGVELAKNNSLYVFYKAGKVSGSEKFKAAYFCESVNMPAKCLARQWGVLYVE
ncbi:MAG TPA: hypothetical protein VNJ01_02035 [Bacteriovoracaceae bacterium]|nr:hypothetical protein [Bacteriovoracaceae bacterium]